MKWSVPNIVLIAVALGAGGAIAQTITDTPERTGSPYDRNPACESREVSSTDPACVINDGPSRYRPHYRQPSQSTMQSPVVTPAPAASGVAAPSAGGMGSTPQARGR